MSTPSRDPSSRTPSGVVLGPSATPEQLADIGRLAADLVRDGDRVGLGSGRAAVAFVHALGERVKAGLTCVGVSTSIATEKLAVSLGIPTVPPFCFASSCALPPGC
jgi:ribose 5-phosphate isomerase